MTENRMKKMILIFFNIALAFTAVFFSWSYSANLQKEQTNAELDTFCATIESMKQVSDNYLRMEQGYVKDWAKYINSKHMTVEEALGYITQANNQKDRYAHIVDMSTFQAHSSVKDKEGHFKRVKYYQKLRDEDLQTNTIFTKNMQRMFTQEDGFGVLGKYRTDDTQANVVSVGTSVTLRTKAGKAQKYLLLRLIPLESIRKIWVFPVEYASAEVGIITESGAYVIPSQSMKSLSFSEFILGYNYEDNYNKISVLLDKLTNTDYGILKYKDSKKQDCYWYYSSFGNDTGLDILGYIPVKALETHHTNWMIVFVICSVFLILIVMDGTYILQINRQLRETAKMAEKANLAKTKFLSTMSHDIRTPMNGIIGMTNIAKSHIGDAQYVKNCLDKVSLASDHLLTLINDILDISKVESGNMLLDLSPFSLEKTLDKLLNIVQVDITTKSITLEIEKNIPKKYLVADELRLNQIFINILTNAVKYTPHGGNIKVSVKQDLLPDRKVRLVYRVQDNGVGMSEEFQKNMYQTFVRETSSQINKIQGTGLGLAIVKQLVDLMQGEIICQSVLNKGTTFTVSIVLQEADPLECKALEDTNKWVEENDFDGLSVLVAEDNEINWEIMQKILEEDHVVCQRAKDGKECIEMMEQSKEDAYDCILMDIQMPLVDGKEATKRIRRSERKYVKNIMIIAMTADAFAEDVQECMEVGMDGHLPKPIDIRKLREVLRNVKQKKDKNENSIRNGD